MPLTINEKYTFTITDPTGIQWQAYPSNDSLKWKWEKLEKWGFWRKILDTELVFINNTDGSIKDFDKLLAIEESDNRCQFILIDVYKICGPVTSLFWKGRIRCAAGDWNKSFCRLIVKPEPLDGYTCLTDNWETELNFAGSVPSSTIRIKPQYLTAVNVCYWEQGYNTFMLLLLDAIENTNNSGFSEQSEGFLNNVRKSCVEFALINCPEANDAGADAWTFLSAKVLYSVNHDIFRTTITMVRDMAFPIPCPDPPTDDPGWILFADNCPSFNVWTRKANVTYLATTGTDPNAYGYQIETLLNGVVLNQPIHNAYGLDDLLEWYTSTPQLPCALPIISNFYKINPDDTAPDNVPYQKATTFLSEVKIVHVSDLVKDDEVDGPDTIATVPYSLRAILENLPNNIDIAIDNGTLRIEHVSYFRRIRMMDLTQPDFVKHNAGNYRYKYDKTKLPKSETFSWKAETDKLGGDFDGYPIKYSGACIDKDSKDAPIQFEIFYSNIQYILGHKADFLDSLDGLIILSTAAGLVLWDKCPISGTLKLNGHFAMSTLHENYYKWDRPLPTGMMNNQPTEFLRWMRQKRQTGIKAPLCCDDIDQYNPDDLVKTHLGWCEVDDVEFDEPKSILKMNLSAH